MHGSSTAFIFNGAGPTAEGDAGDQVRKEMPVLPLILSSDSHVFEPPDLWQTRIDAPFRDRAPRIQRIDGGDHVVGRGGSNPLRDRAHLERRRAVRGARDDLRPGAL